MMSGPELPREGFEAVLAEPTDRFGGATAQSVGARGRALA